MLPNIVLDLAMSLEHSLRRLYMNHLGKPFQIVRNNESDFVVVIVRKIEHHRHHGTTPKHFHSYRTVPMHLAASNQPATVHSCLVPSKRQWKHLRTRILKRLKCFVAPTGFCRQSTPIGLELTLSST